MSEPGSESMDLLMSRYREQFEELGRTQQRLREISVTVTAPRKSVAVTVGHGGFVSEVRFPTAAYKRMTPAELSSAITKAIADAQRQVASESAALVAPTLPAGFDAEQIFMGEGDFQSMFSNSPLTSDLTRDAFNSRG